LFKCRKSHIPGLAGNCNFGDRSHPQYGNQQPRPPFAVLAQNLHNVNVASQHHVSGVKEVSIDGKTPKTKTFQLGRGYFLFLRFFWVKSGPERLTPCISRVEIPCFILLKQGKKTQGLRQISNPNINI
jgi:hypothetical protein